MIVENNQKIKYLLKRWPQNVLAPASWLVQQGISSQLLQHYVKLGWVQKMGPGVYKKLGDKVIWEGAIYAIQKTLQLPFHIGGLSALEFFGYAHFIPLGEKRTIFLFSNAKGACKLPKWLSVVMSDKVEVIVIRRYLFSDAKMGVVEKMVSDISLNMSVPERAILELLALIPQKYTYAHANYIMQSMQTLRPSILQKLLENCRSIKVKRLFLHLTEKNNLPVFKRLKIDRIDLGRGERVIGGGGCYDAKYHISVPILLEEKQEEGAGYV